MSLQVLGAAMVTESGATERGASGARLFEMAAPPVPPLVPDPVIEALKRDVDRTLLRETLRLTPEERLKRLQDALDGLAQLRAAFQTSRP